VEVSLSVIVACISISNLLSPGKKGILNREREKYNIEDVKDPKKYCELCGGILDHHEAIKNYKPIDIIKKICDLSVRYPQSWKTLALTISNPGKTMREYGIMMGISKMAICLNIKRLETTLGVKLYAPKFNTKTGQMRRRHTQKLIKPKPILWPLWDLTGIEMKRRKRKR